MKIVVVGATGETGKHVVKMLLEKGHHVVAYVRTPKKIDEEDKLLEVVQGDIYDVDALTSVLVGTDGIISCLGSSTVKPSDELERMSIAISKAMLAAHVKRIVYMSTAGIEGEFKGLMKWFIYSMIGNVINDHAKAAENYKSNGFDYTIVRPMQLGNGPFTGDYAMAQSGLPKRRKTISRANVAHFLVEAMIEGAYINESVALAE